MKTQTFPSQPSRSQPSRSQPSRSQLPASQLSPSQPAPRLVATSAGALVHDGARNRARETVAADPTVLRIDASARREGSFSRQLGDRLLARLRARSPRLEVIERDLACGVPFVDADWIAANNTAPEARSDVQRAALSLSDALVAEVQRANVLAINLPIYNFGMPAALKAWFDQVCRARLTFRYTDSGPQGLLAGKKALLIVTSGGTPVGSDIDFATRHVRFLLGFIGISEVEVIAADRLMFDGGTRIEQAGAQIDALVDPLVDAFVGPRADTRASGLADPLPRAA